MRTNVLIALCGVLLFHVVSLVSGKVANGDGLGWDGRLYAQMVTGQLDEGSANTQTRPLLPLVTRVPYSLGLDIIDSFRLMNYLYAFVLYLFAALLLERYGATARVRAVVIANLALCIATSKMFGFYPVLVDLGALAVMTGAFYYVATGRRWLGPIACVLAVASREFGIAVALYGIHLALRQRRFGDALAFLPGVAVMIAIRWAVAAGAPQDAAPLSVGDAVANLALWRSPTFVIAFVYFTVTVFGGISVLLALRPRWLAGRLVDEPELATFLVVIVGAAAVGDLDIWRYLMFALPVGVVLIGRYWADLPAGAVPVVAVAMTVATIITQQPFQHMDEALYFRDWFPLYFEERRAAAPDLGPVWSLRLTSLALIMTAIGFTVRGRVRMAH